MEDLHEPTPYAYVNKVLLALLKGVREVLGEQFNGLYLYGSLASGGFDPQRSDIDFMVVTDGLLPEERVAVLEEMHKGLWASGDKWAGKLEGAYVPKELLHKLEPDGPKIPQVNEGRFYLEALGSDWVIQYHILREYGAVVVGPSLQALIEPVRPEELRQAVLRVLEEWWRPMLTDTHRLERSDYQAYAVLTMCRSQYTLQTGEFVSKVASARWAQAKLGQEWRGLIDWAVGWPEDQADRLDEVIGFIKYCLPGESASPS